jgi:hypothetical protein
VGHEAHHEVKVRTALLLAAMRERAQIWEEGMANKKSGGDELTSMVEVLMSVITGLAGTIERQTETIDKLLRLVDEATEEEQDEVKAGTE